MTQRLDAQGVPLLVQLVEPARFVVLTFFGVVPAEQTVIKGVVIANNQAGVGVGAHVFVLNGVMFDQIADGTEQKGGVGTGADRGI
ncbi:hypothetical protein D3C85_1724000 [compost metagenome]